MFGQIITSDLSFATKLFNIFLKIVLTGENVERKHSCQLRAQVLKVAVSRVGPLALRLREGAHIFRYGPTYSEGRGRFCK